MFQFSTTTLINNADAFELISGKLLRAKFGPTFYVKDKDCMKVYKTDYASEAADKVQVTLPGGSASDTYRLSIYVTSINNADPMYANTWVFKGKPFYVEFAGNADADTVINIANKFMLALYDSKQIIFSKSGSNLIMEGTNGYQRFTKVAIEKWVPDTNNPFVDGNWEVQSTTAGVIPATSGTNKDKIVSSDSKIIVTVGCEGYGTYAQVLKDLRLPTADNLRYLSANAYQMPIPTGKYFQYTIELRKELVGYAGGIGINNPTTSITYHHFFVESGVQADFEDALKTFGIANLTKDFAYDANANKTFDAGENKATVTANKDTVAKGA